MEYINVLKKEVDLKKEIKNGTKFKILYDVKEDESGKVIGKPKLTYASLNSGENEMKIYKYEDPKTGIVNGYFYSDGRSLGKTFFNKPIPGARISSGFGMRMHPILKYKKMHKGVDFAARKGTPIKAVASGVVQLAHKAFGYGNYIVIKHNHEYSSLYAHMSKFKPGIKKGQIIKANDIIGYVGNTGMSTSAHLHYEVRYFGKPVNPLKLKFNVNNKLDGKTFVAFNKQKKVVDKLVDKESKLMLASVK
ncbi:MAG: murein DD-endopeptidase MepM/ murein hydrolase activator NlpD [Candidatus Midichloriaceae bacterium]|jgi:murein DD-endopeptidase MepM/ murein hydrolase activator NlpD